jgi:hypothetical protein
VIGVCEVWGAPDNSAINRFPSLLTSHPLSSEFGASLRPSSAIFGDLPFAVAEIGLETRNNPLREGPFPCGLDNCLAH